MTTLRAQKEHLANLLTAIQRSAYFLAAAERSLAWPLDAVDLAARKKDQALYQTLSAFNERYAKLQDVLGATMRHTALLLGERADEFLHVLAYFEKRGVVESIEGWQALRVARNQAAHEYETDYGAIAEHFNGLHELMPTLLALAWRLTSLCREKLGIGPGDAAFAEEFNAIAAPYGLKA